MPQPNIMLKDFGRWPATFPGSAGPHPGIPARPRSGPLALSKTDLYLAPMLLANPLGEGAVAAH